MQPIIAKSRRTLSFVIGLVVGLVLALVISAVSFQFGFQWAKINAAQTEGNREHLTPPSSRAVRNATLPPTRPSSDGKGPGEKHSVESMRSLAASVCLGEEGSLGRLEKIAAELYKDINYDLEEGRTMTNLTLMNAAFTLIGDEAAKGNGKAFSALRYSLGSGSLHNWATDPLGDSRSRWESRGSGDSLKLSPTRHLVFIGSLCPKKTSRSDDP